MQFSPTPLVRSLLVAFGGAALAFAHSVQAADPAPAVQRLDKIEITGSNIKRVDAETPAPVQVISREDIERSGATTVSDLLKTLTVANTGSLTGAEIGNFTPGASTISLRGLGGQATLILINGRRVASYGITGFSSILTNIDSLPVRAIDRIEILKDGASAVYGSDAIAGVVNIIMRRDYTGAEGRISYGQNKRGDLPVTSVGLTGGIGDIAGDRYNVFATYEHRDQDSMKFKDGRGAKSRLVDPNVISMLPGARLDWRSAYSFPGSIYYPFRAAMPGCPQESIGLSGYCRYDYFQDTDAYPNSVRDSFFSRGVLELNADTTLFAEVGLSKSTIKYTYDPQFFYNDYGSGALFVPGSTVGVPEEEWIGLLYRTGDIGNRKIKADIKENRFLVGAKGTLFGWDYDSAIGYAESKVDIFQSNLILESVMNSMIDQGLYIPGIQNSADVIAAISPADAFNRHGKSEMTFVDLRATREIMQLPAGPLAVAAGIEYRSEKSHDAFSDAFVSGDVFGFGALAPESFKRHVTGVFAEANIPLLRTLEASVAVRNDSYSIGGSATVPKIGLKWTASDPLVVRGTYSEGFRAPNLRELSPSTSVGFYNGVRDPARCQNGNEPDCSISIQANISGNANLKPEKSKNYTIGFVLEPAKDINVSFDYWNIKKNNEISQLSLTYLLDNQSIYSDYITRNELGQITELTLPYINIGQTQVSGFDIDGRFAFNAGELGKFTVRALGSYTEKYKVTPVPGMDPVDYNGTWDQPRWRATLSAAWETGPWTTELAMNHIGSFKYIGSPNNTCDVSKVWGASASYCDVFDWTTFNLFVRYKGFKDLELAMSVQNLFDRAPPFDARSYFDNQGTPYNQTYHNALGRYITLSANYKFK